MTLDELGLGELVERLQPLRTADEPIARAVVSTDQAERHRTVEAYLLANNELKRQAADALTSLIAERDEMRGQTYLASAEAAEHHRDNAITMWHDEKTKREAAEAQLKTARKALTEISCPTQTERLLWWQIAARLALSALSPNKGEGV